MNRCMYILCLVIPGFVYAKTTSFFLFGQGDYHVELSREVAKESSSVLAAEIAQGQFVFDCTQFSQEALNKLSRFFEFVAKQELSTWHGMDFLIQHGSSLLSLAHHLELKDVLVQRLLWGQQAANKLS